MSTGCLATSSYERKIQIIMDSNLQRYHGVYTDEQYQLELTVARNILSALGVHPCP